VSTLDTAPDEPYVFITEAGQMDIGQVLVGIADAMETANVTEAAKAVQSPPFPEKFSRTERTIARMMRENTGASILDSGGAYGRAWQRNLTVDFSARPIATVEFSVARWHGKDELDVCPTIDLFHYLTSRLEYDRALTRQFRKFANLPENREDYDLANMEAFPAWIADKRGEDASEVYTGNSYNEDNYLSGTVQFTCFTLDNEEYVLLQIHGGCDVRGGYTAPKVFRKDDNCGYFGDWYDATIAPDFAEVRDIRERLLASIEAQPFLTPKLEAEARADADLSSKQIYWDVGGNEGNAGEDCTHRKLADYPVKEIKDRSEWVKGTVCVLPDDSALCPETGAKLTAYFCS
jgi:hypothetical protein